MPFPSAAQRTSRAWNFSDSSGISGVMTLDKVGRALTCGDGDTLCDFVHAIFANPIVTPCVQCTDIARHA